MPEDRLQASIVKQAFRLVTGQQRSARRLECLSQAGFYSQRVLSIYSEGADGIHRDGACLAPLLHRPDTRAVSNTYGDMLSLRCVVRNLDAQPLTVFNDRQQKARGEL